MKISQEEFGDRLKNGELTITLIGMSGMGKSYRAGQLRDLGFKTYGCDDEIAKKISSLLPEENVGGLAAWMGQPYSKDYKERERQYLELEEDVTRRGLEIATEGHILDTTGSVIYCSPELLNDLKIKTLVVYLESNQEVRDRLFEVYMRDPKPIVWGESFSQEENEEAAGALKRSYPKLLEFRGGKYMAMADVVLPFSQARDPESDAKTFLEIIRSYLS